MPSKGELAAWLRLTLTPGIGGETQRALLSAFGLPQHIYAAGASALARAIPAGQVERLLDSDATSAIDAALSWQETPGNHILTLADATYPRRLLDTPDPPTVLYAKGRIELLNQPAMAIVGSRNATPQGVANAESFAADARSQRQAQPGGKLPFAGHLWRADVVRYEDRA